MHLICSHYNLWEFTYNNIVRCIHEKFSFQTVIPIDNFIGQRTLPLIFNIEMKENEFNILNFREWHIGVCAS
jgi:hypothetical protein